MGEREREREKENTTRLHVDIGWLRTIETGSGPPTGLNIKKVNCM